MNDDAFEWDEIKAAENYAAHGVRFKAARDVFKDAFAIDWLDERMPYGEDRYAVIGMVENRLLYVAYTMRGDTNRIISARGAEPYEKRRYHEENSY
jgi:uncharacterized DUF497 family protein